MRENTVNSRLQYLLTDEQNERLKKIIANESALKDKVFELFKAFVTTHKSYSAIELEKEEVRIEILKSLNLENVANDMVIDSKNGILHLIEPDTKQQVEVELEELEVEEPEIEKPEIEEPKALYSPNVKQESDETKELEDKIQELQQRLAQQKRRSMDELKDIPVSPRNITNNKPKYKEVIYP